jgi:large subunit ribosomal protein L6
MSRIGKQLVSLPEKVTITVADGNVVTVKGPLGEITRAFDPRLTVVVTDNTAKLDPKSDDLETNMRWGTYASHLRNMVEGVSKGYQKQLTMEGVGYKVAMAGTDLNFALGFSHPVKIAIPAGIKVVVDKNNMTITGADKELVGSFAALLRDQKRPEPYKGKGIRYITETVRRKAGKKVTA